MQICLAIFVTVCLNFVLGRDFYVGMFKNNDFLVAQDRLYKERVPYRAQYAKYGRYFKCPITYFRVADRLGSGKMPKVEVVRGGLRKKYIVLRLASVYNQPISVNIYVGCENKMTTTKRTNTITAPKNDEGMDKDRKTDTTDGNKDGGVTTVAADGADTGTPAGPNNTNDTASGTTTGGDEAQTKTTPAE